MRPTSRLYCLVFTQLCDVLTSVVSYTTLTEFVLGQFHAVIYVVYSDYSNTTIFSMIPSLTHITYSFYHSTQVHFPHPCVFLLFWGH